VAEAWEQRDQQLLHHRYGSEKTKERWGAEQATWEDNSEGRPWEEVKKQTKAELIYETTRQGLNVYAPYQSIPRVASLFGRHFHVHLKLVYINVDAAPGSLHEALLVSTSSQRPRVHIAASRRVVMLVFVVIRYRAAVTTFHFILL